jgi:hypothetical protein
LPDPLIEFHHPFGRFRALDHDQGVVGIAGKTMPAPLSRGSSVMVASMGDSGPPRGTPWAVASRAPSGNTTPRLAGSGGSDREPFGPGSSRVTGPSAGRFDFAIKEANAVLLRQAALTPAKTGEARGRVVSRKSKVAEGRLEDEKAFQQSVKTSMRSVCVHSHTKTFDL